MGTQAPAPASSKAISNERDGMTFGMRRQKARVVPVATARRFRPRCGRACTKWGKLPCRAGKISRTQPLARNAAAALAAALRPMVGAIMLLPVDRRSYRPLLLGSTMGLTVLVVAGLGYWDAIRDSQAVLRDLANVQTTSALSLGIALDALRASGLDDAQVLA